MANPQLKNNHFVKVASVSEIRDGESKVIFFQGREVVLFNVKGEFYALANLCPHRGGPLSVGEVSDNVVTCPWHGAKFDLKTGQGLEGPYRNNIRSYKVQIEDSSIKIARS